RKRETGRDDRCGAIANAAITSSEPGPEPAGESGPKPAAEPAGEQVGLCLGEGRLRPSPVDHPGTADLGSPYHEPQVLFWDFRSAVSDSTNLPVPMTFRSS